MVETTPDLYALSEIILPYIKPKKDAKAFALSNALSLCAYGMFKSRAINRSLGFFLRSPPEAIIERLLCSPDIRDRLNFLSLAELSIKFEKAAEIIITTPDLSRNIAAITWDKMGKKHPQLVPKLLAYLRNFPENFPYMSPMVEHELMRLAAEQRDSLSKKDKKSTRRCCF